MDPSEQYLRHFAEALQGDDGSVELDQASFALSAVLQGGLDIIECMATVDALAGECPTPTRDGIVQFVCRSRGFGGDRATYTDWRNSCLDHVLETRRGIPITLSIVVIEVARRLGVPLVGVGMPAHFLVGDADDPNWFADPFHGGQILDRDGCRSVLHGITHGQARWHPSHLDPTPNRAIVARMLNNLKAAFSQLDDPVRLALVMRMRRMLPELADEAGEVARTQAVLN